MYNIILYYDEKIKKIKTRFTDINDMKYIVQLCNIVGENTFSLYPLLFNMK